MCWFLRITGNEWFLRITDQEWCCHLHAPSHKTSVKLGPGSWQHCWGGCKPQTERAQPMGDLDLLKLYLDICLWWHYYLCPVLQPWGQQYLMPWYMVHSASQMLTGAGPWGGTAWDSPLHRGQGRYSHLNVRGGRTALVHNYSLKFCSMQSPLGHSFSAMQSVLITRYEFYCSSMWNLHSAIKWRIIIPGTRSLKLIF